MLICNKILQISIKISVIKCYNYFRLINSMYLLNKGGIKLYFSNPRTIDELKNQYRALLRKYDYMSGKNEALIKKIESEYNLLYKQIERANGQTTLGEDIKNLLHNKVDKMKREIDEEERRLNYLRNKVYTTQDIQNMLNKQKKIIYEGMALAVQAGNITHTSGQINFKSKNDRELYFYIEEFFMTASSFYAIKLKSDKAERMTEILKELKEIRQLTAIAISSTVKRKNVNETELLENMRVSFGRYIRSVLPEVEERFVDPIDTYNRTKFANERVKNNRMGIALIKIILFVVPLVGIVLIFISMYLDGFGLYFPLFIGYFIYIFIMYLLISIGRAVRMAFGKRRGLSETEINRRVTGLARIIYMLLK